MKIEQISCTQFAGIQNRSVSFKDGVNVIFGDNETGKSTIVDLIYELLYHDVGAKKSEKSEKDFVERYYPKEVGVQGDFVDGSIILNTNEGRYALSKTWGEGSGVQLTTPQNIRIQSQVSINKMLSDLLRYRKGLYDDIVFAPQRKQADMVAHIFQSVAASKSVTLKNTSNVKADLLSIITQETIQNAGVDASVFERQLTAIIDSFEGCWDAKKDAPKAAPLRTKRNGDKPKNEGKLFVSYYAVDKLSQTLADARKAELAVDRDMKDLNIYEQKLHESEFKRDQFEEYATQLAEYNANLQLIAHLKEEIKRRRQAAKEYPGLCRAFLKASKLLQEFREAESAELYDSIAAKRSVWEEARKRVDMMRPINREDIDRAEQLEEQLKYIKQKRYGIDILAQLINNGYREIEIRSLADRRVLNKIKPGDKIEEFSILEPVEIYVPGCIRLKLSNHANGFNGSVRDVDACAKELDDLYRKCGIESRNIKELRNQKSTYDLAVNDMYREEAVYKSILGNRDWKVLEQTYRNLSRRKKRRPLASIREDIVQVCGDQSIESYYGEVSASIKVIEEAYKEELGEITAEALRRSVAGCQEKIDVLNDAANKVNEIPLQYKRIKDVPQYRLQMKSDIDAIKKKIKEIDARLQESQKYLGKKTAEEYAAELEQAKTEYERVHELYRHWVHIRDVFNEVRNKAGNNDEMKDVENRFAEYLSCITKGRVVLNSLSDNMDVNITSNNSQLNENILSEGTKDTIALAFRLAMMEHVFPNGEGLLVLDDPFTDMDEDRKRIACSLVRKFASKGNQVIFTTCDSSIAEQLEGNLILME